MIRSLVLAAAMLGQSEPTPLFDVVPAVPYATEMRFAIGADGVIRPVAVIVTTSKGRYQYLLTFEAIIPPGPVPPVPPGPTPGPWPNPTPDPPTPTPTPTPTPAVYTGPMVVTLILPTEPTIEQAALATNATLRSSIAAASATFATYRLGEQEISDPRWKDVFNKYPPPAAFFQRPDGTFVAGGIVSPTVDAIVNRVKSIRGTK